MGVNDTSADKTSTEVAHKDQGDRHVEMTVDALRDTLRKTRVVVDDLRQRCAAIEAQHNGRPDAELSEARNSLNEQRNEFERQLLEIESGMRGVQARLHEVEQERDSALRAVSANHETELQVREAMSGLLAMRTRALSEKEARIVQLTRRVADAEAAVAAETARRVEAEQRLNAVLLSETWKLTAPVRKVLELTKRSAHVQKARVQLVRKALLSGDRDARRVLSNSFRRRLGANVAVPSLPVSRPAGGAALAPHESIVTSYPSWLLRMDTPDAEALAALVATADSVPEVVLVVRLTMSTAATWNELLGAMRKLVGLRWTASVLVEAGADAELVERFKQAVDGDSRFSFTQPRLDVGHIVMLIDSGAIPRPHGPRILVDALCRDKRYRLAYSDEDHLPEGGLPQAPWFKPDFSRLLTKQGILFGKMVALRCTTETDLDVARRLFELHTDPAATVREMALSIDERAIVHVPHVAFHDTTPAAVPLPLELPALPDSLPVVSILIPTRDGWHLLGPCLESLKMTDWPKDKLEVIVIDNGSVDPETLEGLSLAEREGRIRILRDPREFNYPRLNNVAVHACRGDLLVLLNNDTEIIDPAWLRKMAAYALLPDVGAVGPKLLYGDRTVQHGGVVLGIRGVAAHAHLFQERDAGGYRGLANLTHEVAAVTGACLMVSKAAFEEVGGLREELRVAFNDVVFCLGPVHTI
ncbi:hypothetical protein FEQ05_06464 [Burkholderia pseudomultivorans]|uniref:Glycosyltransferase 2-like domain-containing protein n=2 Tax=Burkholderia pseudomultivorans TaxID=1207504 RepID=A0ABU2EEA1_9BURK|nr:hypothetical protein [Burkholderia pseudomultivorans]MDR8739109.1 hypothetical protein [Burkholderia pseudomultivorans]MDR8745817.1 hypothetical protein [Burkholderia pseudomultivorans]MDR8758225.1 hypothetical protein [Burkholderia pseudomultivorans]MDR8782008.1 hypothetical protein [Burkholderia pseudomultivorans]